MEWGVIPEIFYDIIGRLVPGILLLVMAIIVIAGPEESIAMLRDKQGEVGGATILLFLIVAYVVAIVVKEVWGWGQAVRRRFPGQGSAKRAHIIDPLDLFRVRQEMPVEGLRLLKIQAEKALCETLIAGLTILGFLDFVLLLNPGVAETGGRLYVLAPIGITIAACITWRTHLESEYCRCLHDLRGLLKSSEVQIGMPDAK